MGAPDPRDGVAVIASSEIDIEAGRTTLGLSTTDKASAAGNFQYRAGPALPSITSSRAQLEATGVTANTIADPRTLIRRAYFDLIGLPPEPEAVETFLRETDSGSRSRRRVPIS